MTGLLEAAAGYTELSHNAYYNSGWKYLANGYASLIEMASNGDITFNTAASGAADGAITYATPIVLKQNGTMLVNTGTDNGGGAKLQVSGGLTTTGNVGIGTTSPSDVYCGKIISLQLIVREM